MSVSNYKPVESKQEYRKFQQREKQQNGILGLKKKCGVLSYLPIGEMDWEAVTGNIVIVWTLWGHLDKNGYDVSSCCDVTDHCPLLGLSLGRHDSAAHDRDWNGFGGHMVWWRYDKTKEYMNSWLWLKNTYEAIAKIWVNPNIHHMMNRSSMVFKHTGIWLCHKTEEHPEGDHDDKWNKPETETQVSHDLTHMQTLRDELDWWVPSCS